MGPLTEVSTQSVILKTTKHSVVIVAVAADTKFMKEKAEVKIAVLRVDDRAVIEAKKPPRMQPSSGRTCSKSDRGTACPITTHTTNKRPQHDRYLSSGRRKSNLPVSGYSCADLTCSLIRTPRALHHTLADSSGTFRLKQNDPEGGANLAAEIAAIQKRVRSPSVAAPVLVHGDQKRMEGPKDGIRGRRLGERHLASSGHVDLAVIVHGLVIQSCIIGNCRDRAGA